MVGVTIQPKTWMEVTNMSAKKKKPAKKKREEEEY